MDHDSVRRRHPTPASPIVSRRPAAMPVTPRSGATPTAPRQMRFVPAAAPQVTPVTPQATPASPVMAPRRWGIKQCANQFHGAFAGLDQEIHHATGRATSNVAESTLLTSGRLVHAGLKPRKLPKLRLKKRPAAPASPGPRVRQVSIEDDAAPTEPSLLLAAAAAPMPISGSREAGIAKHVSVDSEDEDDWGHFSFEDGDAPPSSLEDYRWN